MARKKVVKLVDIGPRGSIRVDLPTGGKRGPYKDHVPGGKCSCIGCTMRTDVSELVAKSLVIDHSSSGPSNCGTYGVQVPRESGKGTDWVVTGYGYAVNNGGGSIPAEPAPELVKHVYTRSYDWTQSARADWVTVPELVSRCQAAARMVLRGLQWSPEDRADLVADLLERTLSDGRNLSARESGTSVLTTQADLDRLARAYTQCVNPIDKVRKAEELRTAVEKVRKAKKLTGPKRRVLHTQRGVNGIDLLPAKLATFTRLSFHAQNWRRAEEIRRDKDSDKALDNGRQFDDGAYLVDTEHDLVGLTPRTAARSARDMLTHLGAYPLTPRDGVLRTVVYTSARIVPVSVVRDDGSKRDEKEVDNLVRQAGKIIAGELGISYNVWRNHTSHARPATVNGLDKSVPSRTVYSLAAHVAALWMRDYSREAKKRGQTGAVPDVPMLRDWIAEEDHAPVKVSRCKVRTSWVMPDWTRALTTRQHARLEAASRMRQARARRAKDIDNASDKGTDKVAAKKTAKAKRDSVKSVDKAGARKVTRVK